MDDRDDSMPRAEIKEEEEGKELEEGAGAGDAPGVQRVELHAWRPDIVADGQMATLRAPPLSEREGKLVRRWTHGGRPIEDDDGDPLQLNVRAAPGAAGAYTFEVYDAELAAWRVLADWAVAVRGAGLRVLDLPALFAEAPSLTWHFPLAARGDTPLARWERLAGQIAASRGAAAPAIYNNPRFYWLPDAAEAQLPVLAALQAEEPRAQLVFELAGRALAEREFAPAAALVRRLLETVHWTWPGTGVANPDDDDELFAYWRAEVLTLRFYAGVAPPPAGEPSATELATWLLVHDAQRALPPTWRYWVHVGQAEAAVKAAHLSPRTAAFTPRRKARAAFEKAQVLPSDADVARAYGMPHAEAARLLGPLRGDAMPVAAREGVYADAGGAQLLLVDVGEPPQLARARTGGRFPALATVDVAALAGTTHLLWFRGTRPDAAQFALLAETSGPAIALLGRPSESALVRAPGRYSLWAMQWLGHGALWEHADDGAPRIRWQLLAHLQADGAPLDAYAELRARDVTVLERALLEPHRPFALPHSRLTGAPLAAWLWHALNGRGPAVLVPEDAVRVPRLPPNDETALQGRYVALAPIVEEPLLAVALASAGAGRVPLATILAALESGVAALPAAAAVPPGGVSLVRLFVSTINDTALAARVHEAGALRVLLRYYAHLLREHGAALVTPENSTVVHALVQLLVAASGEAEAVVKSGLADPQFEGTPETDRLALVGLVVQHAPGYLPLLTALFTPNMARAAFLAAIDEHHAVLLELARAVAAHARAVQPTLSAAAGQRALRAALEREVGAGSAPEVDPTAGPAPAVPASPSLALPPRAGPAAAPAGVERSNNQKILDGLRRNLAEKAQEPLARFRSDPTAYRTEPISPITETFRTTALAITIGAAAGAEPVVVVVGPYAAVPAAPEERHAVLLSVLRRVLARDEPLFAADRVPVPLYRHIVIAAARGVDLNTGTAYDVVHPRWGDAAWIAAPVSGDDAGGAAAWFRAAVAPAAVGVEAAPLYRALWEGAQRGWPERAAFANALQQLRTLAQKLIARANRGAPPALALSQHLPPERVYAELARLYPTPPLAALRADVIAREPYLVLRAVVQQGGGALELAHDADDRLVHYVLARAETADETLEAARAALARRLAHFPHVRVVLQAGERRVRVAPVRPVRPVHPALAEPAGTPLPAPGTARDADDAAFALDYVRMLSLAALRRLLARFGLPDDALPDLRFAGVARASATVDADSAAAEEAAGHPRGMWIGQPSSWRAGPVLGADALGQALAQAAEAAALADLPDGAARREAESALRGRALRWDSRYVDMTGARRAARAAADLGWDQGGGVLAYEGH